MLKRIACSLAVVLAVFGTGSSYGQSYPTRTVRIVTAPAGGGNDFPARLIARGVTAPLGQQVIVDNRPTVLIADIVAKAPPDGYTLLVTGSAHWIGPLVEKVNYDPIKDFAPITMIDRSPSVLVVHPSMPVKTVKQLVAVAKAKPGALNFSTGAPGTSNFIAVVMLNQLAGVNTVRVPYKGSSPALLAVVTGEVNAMFGSASSVGSHMKSGRLRGIAVGSAKPSPLAPELPTLEASGLPGFISEAVHALYAPAGTPSAIVARLNQEVGRYLQSPEAKDVFLKAGVETWTSTPDELTGVAKAEVAKFGPMLKAAGVGVQ